MKDRLIFDTTDVDSIAASDSVGAYVRDAAGNLIQSQAIGGEQWLNVAASLHDEDGNPYTSANPVPVDLVSPLVVNVDIDGVYDVGTNPTPDSAGAIYHSRSAAPGITEQVERTTAGGLATLAAANLGDVNAVDSNAFVYAIDDVSGDAELLSKDAVSGGLNVHIAGQDGTLTVSDAALANTAIAAAAETLDVANTSQAVVASPLANRKYLFIRNNDNQIAFIGQSGVTTATGFPVSPGSFVELRAGAASVVHFVSNKANLQIRTLELS
jgi:hypothetical protein